MRRERGDYASPFSGRERECIERCALRIGLLISAGYGWSQRAGSSISVSLTHTIVFPVGLEIDSYRFSVVVDLFTSRGMICVVRVLD